MPAVMRLVVAESGPTGLFTGLVPRVMLGIWQTLFMVTGASAHANGATACCGAVPLCCPPSSLRTNVADCVLCACAELVKDALGV